MVAGLPLVSVNCVDQICSPLQTSQAITRPSAKVAPRTVPVSFSSCRTRHFRMAQVYQELVR
jgi:hypothetical protein